VRFEEGHIVDASGREVIEHFDRPAPLQEPFCQVRTDKLCPSRNNCLGYALSLGLSWRHHRCKPHPCKPMLFTGLKASRVAICRGFTPCKPWVISGYGCRPEPYGAVRPRSHRLLRLSSGVDDLATGKDGIHNRLLLASAESVRERRMAALRPVRG
jgi:hypothetical protein